MPDNFLAGLSSFVEPCFLVYDIPTPSLNGYVASLKAVLKCSGEESIITRKCRQKRVDRIKFTNDAIDHAVSRCLYISLLQPAILTFLKIESLLEIGNSPKTHWRYSIFAVRSLRTLVRRDAPLKPSHVRFFMEKVYEDNSTIVSGCLDSTCNNHLTYCTCSAM